MTGEQRPAPAARRFGASPLRLRIDCVLWRGPIAESRHRFQAVVCGPDGVPVAETEGAGAVTTFRSAAKPFQLLPLVERGHAGRWGFGDETLAVMAASHTGSDYHLDLVRGILARIGLTDRDLACGFHEPLDPGALARIRMHPEDRSPLYNNCSGKHAGMLALALAEGWPSGGYEQPGHPVQQLMRRTVGELCGVAPESLAVGVDGCNVCVFGLALGGMARAYARLAAARGDGDPRERGLARIRDAMRAWPRATGGAGRLSAELMERTSGRLVAKGGAEGLECVGLPERGLGLALKCEDGQARGIGPVLMGLLEHLEWLTTDDLAKLADLRRPVIRNHVGAEVGTLTAEIRVLEPAR
jgi:L-asparaginase II